MVYFGISNLDYLNEPFINDKKLFPFIDKDYLLNSIKTNKKFTIKSEEMVNRIIINYQYNNIPILYEHRNNILLKNIWDDIKDGDIVTNRAAKRSLAYPNRNEEIQEKIVELNGIQKRIYLICKKDQHIYTNIPKVNIGLLAEAAIFEYPTRHPYSIYRYMKGYNADLECFEHYTCEIDGFIISENNFIPVELKSYEVNPTEKLLLPDKNKVNIFIQAKLAGIDNIIVGSRNNQNMKLHYFNLSQIEEGVEYKVKKSLLFMDINMKMLINNYKKAIHD